jgi:hypothetical protein
VSHAVGEPGGDKETEVEPGQHRGPSVDSGLGKATMVALAIGLFALLGWHIVYDAQHNDYDGYPVTLLLGGLLGGLIGVRRLIGGEK